ncbi:MAG: cysteine desulfurase [Pseudomonadota bacterium]|nr:cysteine desulfurase [Pseudomonadota bacterium]
MDRVYLDWNATAPLRPEARDAMIAALGVAGNPSSVHGEGRAARRLVEEARAKVAALVGAELEQVTFTSGGTEANMLALTPALTGPGNNLPRDRLLISAIEHTSVRSGGRFPANAAEEIPVSAAGAVDLDALRAMVAKGGRPLVSIMLANNETGVIQPSTQAAQIVHDAGGLLHVDAVQGPGRIVCDIDALGADLLTISAHKLGGPKGVGALIRRREPLHIAEPLIKGGGQERGARAGTENVAGIAGFGAAAEVAAKALKREAAHMAALRDSLEAGLKRISPDGIIFGSASERLPNTTLFTAPGMKAETAVIAFDLDGIAVSSGAACSSGKVQPSHVLAAMGVDGAAARGAVRVSLGPTSTESDVERFLKAWIKLSESLRKGRQGMAA